MNRKRRWSLRVGWLGLGLLIGPFLVECSYTFSEVTVQLRDEDPAVILPMRELVPPRSVSWVLYVTGMVLLGVASCLHPYEDPKEMGADDFYARARPNPVTGELPYWAVPDKSVFHRVHCCDFRDRQLDGAIEVEARDHAVNAGFSPCPECKP